MIKEIKQLEDKNIKISPKNLIYLMLFLFYQSFHPSYLRDKSEGIGTTGRGIGPAYEDKVGRRSIRVMDYLFCILKLRLKTEASS